MSGLSRVVDVDDSDPRITYSGNWFQDKGSYDNLGTFGAPLLSTLHGTNSTGNVTFLFTGTAVSATGSNPFADVQGVSFQCFLDNKPIGVQTLGTTENRLLLCSNFETLTDSAHVLTLQATVSAGKTFWFDYLRYTPSRSVALSQEALTINNTDSEVVKGIGAGWVPLGPGWQTSQAGTKFDFTFTGALLIYYGFWDPNLPWDTSTNTATYAIDSGAPISFSTLVNAKTITAKPESALFNQALFQTGELAAGNHTLEVVYQGGRSSPPLTFEAVDVFGTFPSALSTGPVTPTSATSTPSQSTTSVPPSPTTSPSQGHKPKSHTGIIVGAIFGSLGVIALAVAIVLYVRRQSKPKRKRSMELAVDAFPIRDDYHEPTTTESHAVESKLRPLIVYNASSSANGSSRADSSTAARYSSDQLNNSSSGILSPVRKGMASSNSVADAMRESDSGIRLQSVVAVDSTPRQPPAYTLQ